MKTTVEISDSVFRRMKAQAALQGQSLRAFLDEAIREKLRSVSHGQRRTGWRSVFGRGDKRLLARVQAVIDAEFSTIRTEEWR